jgi:predicted ATPase
MKKDTDRFFVLTGGPGSGKSTLADALRCAGYVTAIEAGRSIIQDQTAIGGQALPWQAPMLFAEMMLSLDLRSYRMAQEQTGTVFFDRGIVDTIGYVRLSAMPVPNYMENAAELFRYNTRVFIAPPWREIFQPDRERKQDFQEAVRTYEVMVETYTEYNYEIVELPRVSVEQRTRFVLDQVSELQLRSLKGGEQGHLQK